MWRINYRGVEVTGNNGQDECIAHHENDKFAWQTLHKTYRSAQVCITKVKNAERMAEIAEMYKQRKEATK